MYFTDWGERSGIWSANLDGSNMTILVSDDVTWPNGLYLDRKTQVWIKLPHYPQPLKDSIPSYCFGYICHPIHSFRCYTGWMLRLTSCPVSILTVATAPSSLTSGTSQISSFWNFSVSMIINCGIQHLSRS